MDKPKHWETGLAVMNADKPGLATNHREHILDQLRAGKLVSDLNKELGVQNGAIYHALSGDEEYKIAREAGLHARLDSYQQSIDTAPDGLALSRAREGFRAQAWRCEREFSRSWGQQGNQVNINANGPVSVQVVSYADPQRTIENQGDSVQSGVMLNDQTPIDT